MKKTIRYTVYLFISVVILLELTLRINNPFQFRVKGDHIILESNKKYVIDNTGIPVLDKTIVHSKNGLGFRGPEKPPDFHNKLSIVTIGGSTTECVYLNEGKTWTDILYHKLRNDFPEIWVNNAGIAGHSTFGHIALIKDHIIPLRPKNVLILAGANDIRRTRLDSPNESLFVIIARHSELCNVILNLARKREAKIKNLTDTYINLKKSDSLVLTDSAITEYLKDENDWVLHFQRRLDTIIDLCISNNIRPVLITQPSMAGPGRDTETNVSLENLKLTDDENGKLWWTRLELYNEGTRKVAKEKNVALIDLAHLLPKSSRYFYDVVHFTNEGAKKTGEILYDSVRLLLRH